MRILQVIDTLAIGGAEKVLVVLSNILHQKGHDVGVLTILGAGILSKDLSPDISIFPLKRRWKFNLKTMWQLVQIAKNYDIIHVHSSHNLRYVWLAGKIFGLDKPLVFHEHYGKIEINPTVTWHQRMIYPKVIFIGVSTPICTWAKKNVGVPENKIFLLHNIVAEKAFNPKPETHQRQYLSFVITGNILRLKNIEFAIEVFSIFRHNQPSTLTIIGQIAELDYYMELLELIRRLELESSVKFIHDCTDIQSFLSEFDIALHTSKFESGPLVLIEYLSQGLPFLSYNTGEIARMTSKVFPFLIMDNYDSSTWASSIPELLTRHHGELRQKLRKYYEKEFSEESYYKQCIRIYESALTS